MPTSGSCDLHGDVGLPQAQCELPGAEGGSYELTVVDAAKLTLGYEVPLCLPIGLLLSVPGAPSHPHQHPRPILVSSHGDVFFCNVSPTLEAGDRVLCLQAGDAI